MANVPSWDSQAGVATTVSPLPLSHLPSLFTYCRCEVIRRRAQFDVERAKRRLHLVQGLIVALSHLDRVVASIRAAQDAAGASASLQDQFALSKEQAEAVLNMSLRRLTSLEANKLAQEQAELEARSVVLGLRHSHVLTLALVLTIHRCHFCKHDMINAVTVNSRASCTVSPSQHRGP